MIAVVTGTVTALDPEGVRLRTEGGALLVVLLIDAADTGLAVGDRVSVAGGPDPGRPGVWLSAWAFLEREGQAPLDVPLNEIDLERLRDRATRGEATVFTRPG